MRGTLRAAFSLLELLVAVALTAVLMWGAVALYTAGARLAATATVEAELALNGRVALDLLTKDLARLAPLDQGYLDISGNVLGPCASIRFVAPIGPNGEQAHVLYEVRNEMLYRAILPGAGPGDAIPAAADYSLVSPLGIRVQELVVERLDSTGLPIRDDRTWTSEHHDLPKGILVTLRLCDARGRINLVLSSGAVIRAAGTGA